MEGGQTKTVGVLRIRGPVRIGTHTSPVRQEENVCLAFDTGPVSCVAGAFECRYQGLVKNFELRWFDCISVDHGHDSCGTPWSLGSIVKRQEHLESFLVSGSVCIIQLCCSVSGLRSDIQSEGVDARGLGFGYVGDPIIRCIGCSIANLVDINELIVSIWKLGRSRLTLTMWWAKTAFGMLVASRFTGRLDADAGVILHSMDILRTPRMITDVTFASELEEICIFSLGFWTTDHRKKSMARFKQWDW